MSAQTPGLPQLPTTFHPSPGKALILLLGSLAFVAGGIFIATRGDWLIGLGGAAFFGLGIPAAILQMNPKKSYLHLDENGFTICGGGRAKMYPWGVVKRFEVTRIFLNKMIVWDFTQEHRDSANLKAFNRSVAGHEAGLPDTYGFKAEELCDLLNRIHSEAVD